MTTSDDISGPWLEIDLDAITHNFQQIQAIAGNSRLMPVIKANGYGHGLEQIGHHLSTLDIFGLCTANQSEALRLRKSDISCPILCLGPYTKKETEKAIINTISLAITRSDQVEMVSKIAARLGIQAQVHLKIDTGLNRVGVPWEKALATLQLLNTQKYISLEGTYTTLTEELAIDELQLMRFQNICTEAEKQQLQTGYRHVASSAFLLSNPHVTFDLARPGIMIIGCYPSLFEYQRRRINLRPSLVWKTRILDRKQLSAGEGVSYHHTYKAQQNESILIAGVGYSDGYPAKVAQKGYVLVNGRRLPLVASVTANHIYIQAEPDSKVQIGDEVVLIGCQENERLTLEELATWAELSAYQLASSISPLLPRLCKSSQPIQHPDRY